MSDSNAYAFFLKEEVRKLLGKKEGESIRPSEIKNRVHEDYQYKASNISEPDIKHSKIHDVELGGPHMWQNTLGSKTIAKFLNIEDYRDVEKHRWTMALIARIFGLPTEHQFRSNPQIVTKKSSPFDLYFTKQLQEAEQTYHWESAVMLLIELLHRRTVTKLTICLDDLHLIFKIMPSILYFVGIKKKRIHLVYAPRHAYALMATKEFIALWKLGIPITILDYKEGLSDLNELGFVFNWLPEEGKVDSYKISDSAIEMIRIKTTSFDRYPFAVHIKSTSDSEIFKSIHYIDEKVNSRYAKHLKPQEFKFSPINFIDYKNWFENRFSRATKSVYHGCKCEIATMNVRDLFYRHSFFVRYKVFQAYKILTDLRTSEEKNASLLFSPHNLFQNGIFDLYPTNPPIVERNPLGRWEISEGHHRLLASLILGSNPTVQVLQVDNIQNQTAFTPNPNTEHVVQNDWDKALQSITNFHRIDVQVYDRRQIETITHSIDTSIYKSLGDSLIDLGMVKDSAETDRFSHSRYTKNPPE